MASLFRSTFVICTFAAWTCLAGFGQSAISSAQSGPTVTSTSEPASAIQPGVSAPSSTGNSDSGTFGAGVKASLLGFGGEVAMRVTHRSNVRAGFNMFNYSRGFNKDGIAYAGQLSFKSFEAHYDFYPWAKSFHISPGLLAYLSDPITATATFPTTQSFTLNGVSYVSDPVNPLTGKGKIKFNQAAPVITVGWGNLVSRREGHHFTVPFEMGVAFQGSPKATLNLAGNVCDSTGVNCRSAVTDAGVQSNLIGEQNKVNNSMSFFKVYPIISLGFGYKF